MRKSIDSTIRLHVSEQYEARCDLLIPKAGGCNTNDRTDDSEFVSLQTR